MITDTKQLVELEPDQPLPDGVTEIPAELQPAARSLMEWALSVPKAKLRAKRKQARQNRKKGRRA